MLKQNRMQRLPEDRPKYLTINQVNNLFVYHKQKNANKYHVRKTQVLEGFQFRWLKTEGFML